MTNENISYRIDLTVEEYAELKDLVSKSRRKNLETIKDKLHNVKKIDSTNKRLYGTKKANQVKIDTSKQKIASAIDKLNFDGKEVTIYAVAKIAKMSYNTVKKYI